MSNKTKILPETEVEMKNLIAETLRKYSEEGYRHYREQEECLDNLFTNIYPDNTNLAEVLAKVACLNTYYSTNVLALNKMANHIIEIKNIESRLKRGDESLIEEMSRIDSIQNRRFYSFATKYCFRYNKQKFPLFDANVEFVLLRFIRENSLKYKKDDLRDYPTFKEVINKFRDTYNLSNENYSIRDLDHFMWIFGREYKSAKKGDE